MTPQNSDIEVPGPVSKDNNVLANPYSKGAVKPPIAKKRTPQKTSATAKVVLKKAPTAPVKVTKSATVRALLDKGKTKVEIVKATGIPYPFVWDIEAAWKRKSGMPRDAKKGRK